MSTFLNETVPFSQQSQPSTFCHAFPRRAACIGMWLSEAVVKPYVFLCGLLLLAGDIEQNPGPIQGRLRAGSCQHRCWMCYECTCVVVVACLVAVALMCSSGTVIT